MVIKLSAISFSASMDSKLCVLTRQIQVAFHSTLQRVQPTSFSKSRSFSQATTRPADGKMEAWVSPSYGAPLIRQ
jgi:hypothetical protein